MRSYFVALGLILILACFLRVFYLNKVPVELFGDELDVGYQAYSILKTGRDIRGYRFPLYFHSFSESRAPLYLYATVPFIAVFGLNEWGVRLPAAVFGLANILLLAWLVKILFNDKKLSLSAAFVLTILPWHLQYSRAAFEVTLMLTFILLGIVFFFKAFSKNYFLCLSTVFLMLSLYVYSTAILFIPLLLLLFVTLIVSRVLPLEKISFKYALFSLAVVFVGALPLLAGVLNNQSQERFSRISIFTDQRVVERIILKRGWEGGWGRIFHNKITEIGKEFVTNYLSTFSPEFLFLNGDPNPRHSVGGMGEVYLVFFPFLLLGIFNTVKNLKQKENWFVLGWLLASPLPSSLTQGGGEHATRLFLMLPPLVILIGKGIKHFLATKSKYRDFFLFAFSAVLLINFLFYVHQYFFHYGRESWQYWHYGYKEAIRNLALVDNKYDRVIINNNHEPVLIRFLFWGEKDPSWFRDNFLDDKDTPKILGDLTGFKLGKYFFVRPKEELGFLSYLNPETIYIAFQGDDVPGDWDFEKKTPAGVKVLKTIRTPLNNPYIYLLTGQ